MFKQFIQNFSDSRIYLVSSLWIFLVFFILVAIMLIIMNKSHIQYMSNLPLTEGEDSENNEDAQLPVVQS